MRRAALNVLATFASFAMAGLNRLLDFGQGMPVVGLPGQCEARESLWVAETSSRNEKIDLESLRHDFRHGESQGVNRVCQPFRV